LTSNGSPVIRAGELAREIAFLRDRGARFLTFGEIAHGVFPAPNEIAVAVCFDDCFAGNYAAGLPTLQELGVKATFFQTTGIVNAATLIWEHSLYWLTRNPDLAARFRRLAMAALPQDSRLRSLQGRPLVEYFREELGWPQCAEVLAIAETQLSASGELASVARSIYPSSEQLRQASRMGHEIASHGHQHLKRSNISSVQFETDLIQSKAVLIEVTGRAPCAYSYPFDSHLPEDGAVTALHFELAATVAKRAITRGADPMWMPRFTWPGPARNALRLRRWLLTGTI
jgi:peptidoglycan/xylan/chitin deacetylase (PgdA/CDA1 family)